jgi:ABC-2 type transport system ATP-binding protein
MTTAIRPSRRHAAGRQTSNDDPPRALTKRYGDRIAVDTLDLEVRSGEIFGLLGQNGQARRRSSCSSA